MRLHILRYFARHPVRRHRQAQQPLRRGKGDTLAEAYHKAHMADRLAAFGGAIALNREVDRETAELIAATYAEVVVAPGFAPGVLDIFARWKNLRVMRDPGHGPAGVVHRCAVRGLQEPDRRRNHRADRIRAHDPRGRGLPARSGHLQREGLLRLPGRPLNAELDDLLFGWLVETGITSNSVIYVKDGATVGIGTGEQDRVGVAEIARDKAYRKLADRLSWESFQTPYAALAKPDARAEIDREVARQKGGIAGSCMVSDGFFPFRDGVDVGIREGVTAIVQPGGSDRDFESIEACNEAGVAMVYTGQRCFKH